MMDFNQFGIKILDFQAYILNLLPNKIVNIKYSGSKRKREMENIIYTSKRSKLE